MTYNKKSFMEFITTYLKNKQKNYCLNFINFCLRYTALIVPL